MPWVVVVCVMILLGSVRILFAAPQVSQLKARHKAGQTLLTWKEVDPPVTQETITVLELLRIKKNVRREIHYRIYRAHSPITSVDGLKPIAEVPQLTCWNTDYHGIYPKAGHEGLRYVVEDGEEPVPPGTGIYAHNPLQGGTAYYAVTVVIDGRENTEIAKDNSLQISIKETVGPGIPVLQRVVRPKRFQFIADPTLYYYVRWEAPPNASIESKPFDYLVAIPPRLAQPAPVGIHLHAWGGSINRSHSWWYNAEKGAIFIATNQIPYDWWTGYHEFLWTGRPLRTPQDWQQGVVKAYSQKRILSFLDWVATKWDVDLKRTFVAGPSMGGSGSLMLALRFPDRIAWAVSRVGVHIPSKSPRFKNSYSLIYGKPEWGIKFEDGTPVWDYFNDVWYLYQFPSREIGFIIFANGKNDHGIGWPQTVEFFQALQATKRPHLFVWGQAGHSQHGNMPLGEAGARGERLLHIDIRTDQSLPAFTHSSLDDHPGNGDPEDGDRGGQVNEYLYWTTHDIVDEIDRWEMTIGIFNKAPKAQGTVNVTPRRCQQFKARPGEKFKWTNTSLENNKILQSGQAMADKWGLVTLEQVIVNKGKNRLLLTK